jgi:RNA polymerase sigma factor (sigma-70 family)
MNGLLAPRELLLRTAVAHAQQLTRFLARQVSDVSEAPDLLQELYLRIPSIKTPGDIRAPKAYLFTMASHIAGQHRVRRDTRLDVISLECITEAMLAERSPGDGAAEFVTLKRRLEELNRRLDQLPPKVRAALIWHHRDGYTCDEIAEKLSVVTHRAKKYLVKGLAHCRAEPPIAKAS